MDCTNMVCMSLPIKANFGQKKAPGPITRLRALLPPVCTGWIGLPPGGSRCSYCTTVTARRFWLQQEMSLQMATGRSLPNDWLVMRWPFTPLETR